MLVLTRKVGERIYIGDSIVVTVVRIQNDHVRVGIEAPRNVTVHREEVIRRLGREPRSGRPSAHSPSEAPGSKPAPG